MSNKEKIIVSKEDYKKMTCTEIVRIMEKNKSYRIVSAGDNEDRYIIHKS